MKAIPKSDLKELIADWKREAKTHRKDAREFSKMEDYGAAMCSFYLADSILNCISDLEEYINTGEINV